MTAYKAIKINNLLCFSWAIRGLFPVEAIQPVGRLTSNMQTNGELVPILLSEIPQKLVTIFHEASCMGKPME